MLAADRNGNKLIQRARDVGSEQGQSESTYHLRIGQLLFEN
jgi:hypothetical protein